MKNAIIIFSKNSPMLLDALLRSILKHKIDAYVFPIINFYDSSLYLSGYSKLYSKFKENINKNIYILIQNLFNFKQNIIYILENFNSIKVQFMVDDDIVFNHYEFPELKPFQTHSVRLHKGIKNKKHFDYPMSLDGNIFRTEDILPLLKQENYRNPNELEIALQGNHGHIFTMTHNEIPALIGFKHTRVSDASHCDFTGLYTPENLTERYINGEIIDLEAMTIKPENDVHTSMPYIFKTIDK